MNCGQAFAPDNVLTVLLTTSWFLHCTCVSLNNQKNKGSSNLRFVCFIKLSMVQCARTVVVIQQRVCVSTTDYVCTSAQNVLYIILTKFLCVVFLLRLILVYINKRYI